MKSRVLFILLVALYGTGGATASAQSAGITGEIRATTTRETGDRGGRYFGMLPDPGKTRRYYLAAENVTWNYAPAGDDAPGNAPLPPALAADATAGKIRYRQYLDATFTTRALADPSLGVLGPALRGVVGEFIVVTLLNRTDQPLSLHPHGVRYDKDSEGAYYRPSPGLGAAVAPGARFTYVWFLDAAAGPLPSEPASRAWLYHSHVAGDAETNLGLVGPLIVTDPERARADGTPRDCDREFATLFMVFDESGLDDAAIEAAEYAALPGAAAPPLTWTEVQQALAAGARPSINGRMFGQLTGLTAHAGERVRWYLFGLGSQNDRHAATWSGLPVTEDGRRTSAVELLPASMKVADLHASAPGEWLLGSAVATSRADGMFARFTVLPQNEANARPLPTQAFRGHPGALRSARLTKFDVDAAGVLQITGIVTVYEGYAIFNQPFTLALGTATATFQPDLHGRAASPDGRLTITNASEFGVIKDGLLAFSATLSGTAWRRAAAAWRATPDSPATLAIHCGRAQHTAEVGGLSR